MRSSLISSAILVGMAAVAGAPAKGLAIFRAGQHTSVDGRTLDFTQANIDDLVASYDPAGAEAPIVVGHPKLDAPAYGWAKSLTVRDGVVYAEPHQVEPQFAELVNAGRYKKISASIYMPDSPGNPKPGHFYLRHIGFLGAAAPAVKGLPSAQFGEHQQALEFADSDTVGSLFGRIVDKLVARDVGPALAEIIDAEHLGDPAAHFAERTAQAAATPPLATLPPENVPMSDPKKDIDARQAELDKAAADLKTREDAVKASEKKIADREAADARTAATQFAEQLVTAGKILPRQKEGVIETQLALAKSAPVSFAEGDATVERPLLEVYKQQLVDQPKAVDFSEKTPNSAAIEQAADFAAPAGVAVDPSRTDLYQRAKAHQAKHPGMTLADAAKAVGG